MQPPSSNNGPPDPNAGRNPWGRAEQKPFRIGVGPAALGGIGPSGGPAPAPPPPSEGILGASPLLPRKPRPAILGADSPATVAPPEGPPPDLSERLTRFDEEEKAAPISRRVMIAGVAAGVLALIAVAAIVMAGREAQFDDDAPEAAATSLQAQLRPSVPVAPAAAPTVALAPGAVAPVPGVSPPPLALTGPATLPAPATAGPPTAAPPTPAPVVAAPVLPPPEPVVIAPVVEPPPVRRPAPPPAARQAEDPDAPFVLRKGED